MKSIYDDNGNYNTETIALDLEARTALKGIFEAWVSKGYSPRDISHVIVATAHEIELMSIVSGKIKDRLNKRIKK